MSKIVKIEAFELFDSRGFPTVSARVFTEGGGEGFAIVPSGASTGMFEAHELRDGGRRLCGRGVKKAVEHIKNLIAPALLGHLAENGAECDKIMCELDGTENKERLGANAILAVSLAVAKAAADEARLPLYKYLAGKDGKISMPRPMMNILNGGAHASNNIDIQEFMIQPVAPSSFAESMEICCEIYHVLKKILTKRGLLVAVGDEGGFAPNLRDDEEALELLSEAIIKANYSFEQVKICIDAAASEWYRKDGIYRLPKRDKKMDGEALVDYWEKLSAKYPIISIEDGIGESDFENFSLLTKRLGDKIQLVGDDLFVTNEKRLGAGLLAGAANAILIKPNQIGTLSETLSVIKYAQENGYSTVISHRSGDSEDTFIADLSVAVGAGQIKTGAPARSERVAKYNRLLLIENSLE